MFTTHLDIEAFANVLALTTITSRQRDGTFWTTTGRHADLGAVILIEGSGYVIVSELPFRIERERRDPARLTTEACN